MKSLMMIVCAVMLAACSQQAEDKNVAELQLDSYKAKLGYLYGMDAGDSAKLYLDFGGDLDRAALFAGINDMLDGVEPKLSREVAAKLKQEHLEKQNTKRATELKLLGEKYKTTGPVFLAEYAKKEGVTVTKSGLHYEIIKQGDGAKPESTDTVTVIYSGTLMDGKVFNPFHKLYNPATFTVDKVIKGWTEGLQLMSVGSKFKLVLPPELAYGEGSLGARIPANSVMVFEIELMSIEKDKSVNAEVAK